MDYIAQPKDYWIATNAINITRNALGSPNRIQCSVASGAAILCYIEGVAGLGYDNGHRFRTWLLTISPTYFNSNTEKYVYVAIPRSVSVGTQAVVVFPSEQLDIYGVNADDEQVGSTDYYYIWLQGIITETDGTSNREWQQTIDFGKKGTDEDLYDDTSSEWFQYSKVNNVVTFLKNIRMKAGTTFQNLILGNKELTGVATSNTAYTDSNALVATPGYVESQYLSKTHESTAQEQVGFLKGLWVKAKNLFGIDANGNAKLNSVKSDDIHSDGYSDDTLAGSGYHVYKDANGNGHVCTDILDVRKKARFTELEIRRLSYINADQVQSMAASKVEKVLPIGADGAVISSDDTTTTVVAYRCLAVADDGSTATKNGWALGDQARCQTFNISTPGNYQNVENRFYWRLVVRVGQCYDDGTIYPSQEEHDGKVYHFFDLANIMDVTADAGDEFDDFFADEYATKDVYEGYMITLVNNERTNLNDIPATEDAVVQMGNKIDTDRMGFFITKADNLNTGPYIYAGVNNFTLVGKMITKITPAEVLISARKLQVFSDPNAGDASPLTHYRGDWEPVNGVNPTSYYYDEWDYQGSRWLCLYQGAEGITCAPGEMPSNAPQGATVADYWKQISLKGEKGDSVLTGYCDYFHGVDWNGGTRPEASETTVGTVDLLDYHGNNEDMIDVGEEISGSYSWEGHSVPLGSRYMMRGGDFAIYVATANGWIREGKNGTDGASVSYDAEHSSLQYAVSQYGTAGSGRSYPSDISSWQDTMPAVQKGKYLWTKDTTAYNNGGTIVYDVTYGVTYWPLDGESVEIDTDNTFVKYSTVKTAARPADNTFTLSSPPSLSQGDYLWSLTQVKYVGIDTPLKSYSVSRVGTDGDDGDPGSDGYTTHFAYAKLKSGQSIPANGKLTTAMVDQWARSNFAGADAIGTYRDQTGADSTDISSYTWTKWKGEDGTSIMAQYAPNNNPSSSQIHDTWQTGDIYMRTKSTSESSWSSWHKIVGESGGETDYTFNISSVLATNNPSDPTIEPSPCGLLEWADAPVATTSTYPYLWMRIVKKTWNASTQSYTSGTPTYVRITGKDGQDGQDGKDGKDGYSVTLTPSTIIINQSEELTTVGGVKDYYLDYTNATAILEVKKGGVPVDASITRSTDGTCSVPTITHQSTGRYLITMGAVNKHSGNTYVDPADGATRTRYYDKGRITINVTPNGASETTRLYLDFRCNLQGTLKTTIKGDVETTVAEKITYGYNNETGSVGSLQAVGKYIRSSEKNIAKLTETVGSTNYGNNLFGFSKGAIFDGAVPFVQGYGMACVWNNGQAYSRVWNLDFGGKPGYYVVTCEIKAQSEANIRFFLADIPPVDGVGLTNAGNELKVAVTTQWKKITAVYNLTAADIANSNGQLTIRDGSTSNYVFIRYLQIERGSVPSAFGICSDDAANNSEPMHVTWNQSPSGGMFSDETSGNYGPGGTSKYTTNRVYPSRSPQYPEGTGYIELIKGDLVMTEGIYTLSFWARASVNESVMECFCYDATNTETYKGVVAYCDGLDTYYGELDPDQTEGMNLWGTTNIRLTTAWKKYYVHWYLTGASSKISVIPIRINGSHTGGDRIDYYIAQIKLERGYVTSANRTVYETVMKQTARRMDFSVLVNSMEKAGIHLYTESNGTPENEAELAKGIIDLVAGKVKFKNAAGTVDDKVWIDTTYGTLHAVNGDFSGKIHAVEGDFTDITSQDEHVAIVGTPNSTNNYWRGLAVGDDPINGKGDLATIGGRFTNASASTGYGYLVIAKNTGSGSVSMVTLNGNDGSVGCLVLKAHRIETNLRVVTGNHVCDSGGFTDSKVVCNYSGTGTIKLPVATTPREIWVRQIRAGTTNVYDALETTLVGSVTKADGWKLFVYIPQTGWY